MEVVDGSRFSQLTNQLTELNAAIVELHEKDDSCNESITILKKRLRTLEKAHAQAEAKQEVADRGNTMHDIFADLTREVLKCVTDLKQNNIMRLDVEREYTKHMESLLERLHTPENPNQTQLRALQDYGVEKYVRNCILEGNTTELKRVAALLEPTGLKMSIICKHMPVIDGICATQLDGTATLIKYCFDDVKRNARHIINKLLNMSEYSAARADKIKIIAEIAGIQYTKYNWMWYFGNQNRRDTLELAFDKNADAFNPFTSLKKNALST